MQVKALPPSATVQGVEWLSGHEPDLSIAIDMTTAPDSYRLSVRGPGSNLVRAERVSLKVLAP